MFYTSHCYIVLTIKKTMSARKLLFYLCHSIEQLRSLTVDGIDLIDYWVRAYIAQSITLLEETLAFV